MNPNTGEIRYFENAFQAMKEGFTEPVNHMPNRACEKCDGTGAIKIKVSGKKKKFKPCPCTFDQDTGVYLKPVCVGE